MNTEVIQLPVSDPVVDPMMDFPEEDLTEIWKKMAKEDTLKASEPKVENAPKDTVEIVYHNPAKKERIKAKKIFSSKGLIMEEQMLWKNETTTFEYEYF